MKCSRFSLSLWCTVLSGAAIVLGSVASRLAYAHDPYFDASTTADRAEQYNLPPTEHYYPLQESDDTTYGRSTSVKAADNVGAYHYEYPEDDRRYSPQRNTSAGPADANSASAEAYALKYGYHGASSRELYGNEQADTPDGNETTDGLAGAASSGNDQPQDNGDNKDAADIQDDSWSNSLQEPVADYEAEHNVDDKQAVEDGYTYYGHRSSPDQQSESQAAPKGAVDRPESGVEWFGWAVAELLTNSDRDLLRTLERLSEEPCGVRRAVLDFYLEALGSQSADLVRDFEDATGIDVLTLADDVSGTAALLSVYRLLDSGELAHDEAIDLLERSLLNRSTDWTNEVRAITANAYETGIFADSTPPAASASVGKHGVPDAMMTLVVNSLLGVGEAVWNFSQRVSMVDWHAFLRGLENSRAANDYGVGSDWFQR